MKKTLLLSMLAIGLANLASAQVTVFASASVKIIAPLTVTKNSDLDFGILIAISNGGGYQTAYLDPLQVALPTYNGILQTGSSAPHAGIFSISGAPNASISISSLTPGGNPNLKLTSANPYVTGTEIQMDPAFAIGSTIYTSTTNGGLNQQFSLMLDASGRQQISIGGTLTLSSAGIYEGVYSIPNAMTFTVNYN